MQQIQDAIEWIKSIQTYQIIDILIAILIYLVFKILSKGLSYITIKMFKPKIKNKKIIKENPFFAPLRAFYILIGIYFAIIFLKAPLGINESIISLVNKIFKIAVIIILANGITNSVTVNSNFVNRIKQKVNPDLEDSMFKFILKAIKILIYIIAGFLVITELGYNLNGLVAGLGIGSVVITLAAQDTAKNLFGGLVVFLDKPFVVGDWIEVSSYEGIVEDITFRSTRVRTFENSIVNIPNSVIASESITNWSRMEKRRNKVNLCLELDTPLEKVQIVQKKIKEMLMQHDDVIDNTIIVRFDKITDNGINILICSYTNSIDYASFVEEKEIINFNIMKILKEENVELAYDTKTVVMKK
jgi:MscS family membrane protein